MLLLFVQLSGQNPVRPVNDFLEVLKGDINPTVSWYTGTHLDPIHSLASGFLNVGNTDWSCKITSLSAKPPEVLDMTATFKLSKGSASSAAVAVSFNFDKWSTENYLLVPAIVYNGNRYRAIGNAYNPDYPKDMYYNPGVPLTISNNPRLSNQFGEASFIELQTVNASTPAVCFFSPSLKKGFILLSEQDTRFGNSGISIEENAERTKAFIKISAPSVRKLACGFGDFFPSGDKAADWESGDELSLRFRLYAFDAVSIPNVLQKFMEVRKSLTGPNNPRNRIPMSKHFELASGICSNNWITVPAGSYYMPENSRDFQLGWVSGMMNTYPMLALNNQKERERVVTELDFVVDNLQGESGYFYGGITAEGKIHPKKMNPKIPQVHAMVRKNCDALLWMISIFCC